MKKLPLFFLFATLLVACADKNEAIDESYYGTIPCADCPAIEYELHLHDDNTFNESMLYLERSADAHKEDGTYTIEKDSIIVLDRGANEGFERFVIRDNKLVILDIDGQSIVGDLASYYVLSKERPKESSRNKVTEEYSFKAQGNEPFWNVRFGLDDKIYITGLLSSGEVSYTFPMPEAKELNEHAKSYRIENDELEMDLLVSSELCNDTMADISYTHKVSLQLKLADWDTFQELEGCGNYDGIYQLNNVWMLASINGEEIDKNNRNAHLQFNIENETFYGNGGCNNINGSVKHTETTLTFDRVATTLMACENLEEEAKFLTKLEGSTYDIKLSKNDLTLSNEENELVFKRLD